MDAAPAFPKADILIVGDSKFLLELIRANLAPRTAVTILFDRSLATGGQHTRVGWDTSTARFRLVVLALSQSCSEPVVILDYTGLTGIVGVVPLLIISDRPFIAGHERLIFHMPFPFQAHHFQFAVDRALQIGASAAWNQK